MLKFTLPALFVLLLACSFLQAQAWKLAWSDEFDKDGLPDPTKWGYEEGFIRNAEQQYYTKARAENARVEKGMLVIEGRKEKFPNARYRAGGRGMAGKEYADYTSASINTLGKVDWLYGRVEIRAKIPQGKGVWPAIWMMGIDRSKVGWPACGEIDIMEFVGHTPDKVHSTVHFRKGGQHKSSGHALTVANPFDDFHVYAMEWDKDHMDFFFDQQKVHTFTLSQADENGQNAFRKQQYLMLNLALGGNWGKAIDDANLPQKFLVDYVRVYQKP
jgi:beta-glucanase (GH16 family)